MSPVDKSLISKLQKLIAHAESAKKIGNIAEAAAFSERVQELLLKHKLSMDDVAFNEREESEPIDFDIIDPADHGHRARNGVIIWQFRLARAVAKSAGCEVLRTLRSNQLYFVGRASDREAAVFFFKYLLGLAKHLAKKSARALDPDERGRNYREAWRDGFSTAIAQRLRERMEETMKQAETVDANTTALMHMRKDAVAISTWIKDFVKERTPKKAPKDRVINAANNHAGYMEGYVAGQSVALTPHTLEAK